MANILRCSFDSKHEWPVKDVTVYEDRAQVVRILEYKTTDAGDAELKINDLPTSIIVQSIRAEVSSAQGSVLAVASQNVTTHAETILPTEREYEIEALLKTLRKESQVLEERKELLSTFYKNMVPTFESAALPKAKVSYLNTRTKKNRARSAGNNLDNLLTLNRNNFTNNIPQQMFNFPTQQQIQIPILQPNVQPAAHVNQNQILKSNCVDNELFKQVASAENLEAFSQALQVFSEEQQKILKRQGTIKEQCAALVKERQESVADRTKRANASVKTSKEISVLVHVPEEVVEGSGLMEVKLTYVVNNCGWKANYDVRVFKEDKKVDISYYGQVKNGSGEDWKEVQIFLSTAKPAREGNLPPLPRAEVKYYVHQPVQQQEKLMLKKLSTSLNMRNVMPAAAPRRRMSMTREEALFDTAAVQQELELIAKVDQSTAQDRGGSATFKLNRLCTIESDNVPHKQNIGTIGLNPNFTYVMTPQLSAYPYLLCTARNNSNFILVRGPMQVFFNGSYVTRTEMRLVNKNQEFRVFLGKDETLKLTMIPQKSEKELTKGGLMTAKVNKETFTRSVTVENTGAEEVSMMLYEQVPLARDNKIKVQILKPVFDSKSKNHRVSHFNHLETKRKLKAGKSWKFTFSYQVEWPKNTDLVYTESLENLESQIK